MDMPGIILHQGIKILHIQICGDRKDNSLKSRLKI